MLGKTGKDSTHFLEPNRIDVFISLQYVFMKHLLIASFICAKRSDYLPQKVLNGIGCRLSILDGQMLANDT